MIFEQRMIQGGIAADVRMFEAVAREPARDQTSDGALDTVVFIPVNLMDLNVHTTCGVPLRRCAGRGAEDRDSADLLGGTKAHRPVVTKCNRFAHLCSAADIVVSPIACTQAITPSLQVKGLITRHAAH